MPVAVFFPAYLFLVSLDFAVLLFCCFCSVVSPHFMLSIIYRLIHFHCSSFFHFILTTRWAATLHFLGGIFMLVFITV